MLNSGNAMNTETQQQTGTRKTKAQHAKLAKLLEAGTPVCSALEQAGWPPTQARKGIAKVPLAVYGMLTKKAQSLIKLGKETGKEDRKHLVRGRLIENITKGTDKGAMSAKILGSDSELSMWQPELQAGLIVLQVPPQIANMTEEERARLLAPPEE
jgi:hypothetical protein